MVQAAFTASTYLYSLSCPKTWFSLCRPPLSLTFPCAVYLPVLCSITQFLSMWRARGGCTRTDREGCRKKAKKLTAMEKNVCWTSAESWWSISLSISLCSSRHKPVTLSSVSIHLFILSLYQDPHSVSRLLVINPWCFFDFRCGDASWSSASRPLNALIGGTTWG